MKMILYSYQTKDAVRKLKEEGVLRLTQADEHFTWSGHSSQYTGFRDAYAFMIHEMKRRLPPPKFEDTAFPIWAWNKTEGKKPPTKNLDGIHRGNVRLRIEIDEERVLLSDFDYFAYLVGGGLYFKFTKEDEEYVEKHLFDPIETFYPDWQRIFNLHRKHDDDYGCSVRKETIQATFWELFIEDVTEFKVIPPDFPCEIMDIIEHKNGH